MSFLSLFHAIIIGHPFPSAAKWSFVEAALIAVTALGALGTEATVGGNSLARQLLLLPSVNQAAECRNSNGGFPALIKSDVTQVVINITCKPG